MTPPMTNDLIERLRAQAAYDRAHYPPANPLFSEAAAHIEALAERVREMEGALDDLMDAEFAKDWRSWSPVRARHFLGMGRRYDAYIRARQARKDKENG